MYVYYYTTTASLPVAVTLTYISSLIDVRVLPSLEALGNFVADDILKLILLFCRENKMTCYVKRLLIKAYFI